MDNKYAVERIEQELNRLRRISDKFERKSDEAYAAHDEEAHTKYDKKMEIIEEKIDGIVFCLESFGYKAIHPMDGYNRDFSRFIVVER